MCGIAGTVDLHGRPADPSVVEAMAARLVHRGPDESGLFSDGPVSLGHRRLSIIDLSTGQQPMASADGTVVITFNGEIYNFLELRPELERAGRRFLTHSDTETILHAYAVWGVGCLTRLRGMFAFAIWDKARRQLFIARDRLGKKPLFYASTPSQFAFASELHALLANPAVSRNLDDAALDQYFTYGYIPAPRTAFSGIQKLNPGHSLLLDLNKNPAAAKVERYWQLSYGPKLAIAEEEAARELVVQLTEAVRLRMIADVPVGALLSGGTDSSVVVALMAGLSRRKIKTFSIGFDEAEFNELPHARRVAERYGTEHSELIVRPEVLDVLPELVRHYGEPYADSSAVPTYYVAKLTRQHVTVALNGDGGDECLGGYERYLGSLLAERYRQIPRSLRRLVVEPAARFVPDSLPRGSRIRQAKRFVQAAGQPSDIRYVRWMTYFTSAQKEQLYAAGFKNRLKPGSAEQWLLELIGGARNVNGSLLDRLLAADVESYLPYDLLVKMDIAAMANSLEARSPFLDHKVMEFCAKLSPELKIRKTALKYLLKKVGADLVPAENLKRRKMGFGVPVGRWMRGEHKRFVSDTLLSDRALRRGYFNPVAVRELISRHESSQEDNSQQIWSLLWFELWQQTFVD